MFNKNKQLGIHFTGAEVFLKSSFVKRCQKNLHGTIRRYFLLRKQVGGCCKIHRVAWGLGFKFLLEVPLRRQCGLDPTDKLVLRRKMGEKHRSLSRHLATLINTGSNFLVAVQHFLTKAWRCQGPFRGSEEGDSFQQQQHDNAICSELLFR